MSHKRRFGWTVVGGVVGLGILVMIVALSPVGRGARSSQWPGVVFVGRNLVATVKVLAKTAEVDYAGGTRASVLEVEVQEVHWVGQPEPSLVETPEVAPGDRFEALSPPGYDYRVGETYAASFSYHGSYSTVSWWLAEGIAVDGRVVTSEDDPEAVQALFSTMDASDGDIDPPGEFLAELAAEWEAWLNARDRGVPVAARPLGPLLRAMFTEAGMIPDGSQDGPGQPLDFVDLPPEQRVFPSDFSDAPEMLARAEQAFGITWVPLEAMILHDGTIGDSPSLALWFPGVGRTAEFFIDSDTGVTIVSSLVPKGKGFEIVAFPPTVAEDGLRTWNRTIARVVAQERQPDGLYLVIDVRGDTPTVESLLEDQYFQLVLDMQNVLDGGVTGG
ncbi:MAG: hypothetical protein KatS3mg011_0463 [Acidimicrobiia bacterium]|nr:MAG: hypothetical protein KatS3mg011_0463 [Acidimicrobiia bacterium]